MLDLLIEILNKDKDRKRKINGQPCSPEELFDFLRLAEDKRLDLYEVRIYKKIIAIYYR